MPGQPALKKPARAGFFAVSTLALLLAALPADAEIYKWKDAQGRVHFSDQPPERGAADVLKQRDHSAAEAAGALERKAHQDKENQARLKEALAKEEARKQQEAEAEAKRRQDNCRRAQANLDTLARPHSRMIRQDAQGNRVLLDDAGRQAEADKARREMAENCR